MCMCRYIERPLLIQQRKFHLRVYVLCVGSLKAYVFDQVLPHAVMLASSFSVRISNNGVVILTRYLLCVPKH